MKDLVSQNSSRTQTLIMNFSSMVNFEMVGTSINQKGHNQYVTFKSKSLTVKVQPGLAFIVRSIAGHLEPVDSHRNFGSDA